MNKTSKGKGPHNRIGCRCPVGSSERFCLGKHPKSTNNSKVRKNTELESEASLKNDWKNKYPLNTFKGETRKELECFIDGIRMWAYEQGYQTARDRYRQREVLALASSQDSFRRKVEEEILIYPKIQDCEDDCEFEDIRDYVDEQRAKLKTLNK